MNRVDALDKLQHLLQALAFSLMIPTIEQAFNTRALYGPSLVYSLLIGTSIWAIVDLGRHLIPSARETGWPPGIGGFLLVALGVVGGFAIGNVVGDAICQAFGLFPPGAQHNQYDHLRDGAMITLLAGSVGSYWFYSRNRSAYLLRKMGEAQQHAQDARLKLLESQLEPHMLFNTLANLRALIGVDPARAQHMLDHMIAYLRATLDASRGTTHPLHKEFDRLRDYLELMAIRMGPRLAYELALPDDLAQVRVPTLLLQPLVENSIQHGLEPKVDGGRITVRAAREQDKLVLSVDDTGVGDGHGPSNGSGFGLAQVRERLSALHRDDAALDFRSAADGAHARITLPIA